MVWEQNKEPLFKDRVNGIVLRIDDGTMVTDGLPVCKMDPDGVLLILHPVVSDIKYTGLWKIDFHLLVFILRSVFDGDGSIILKHTDCHSTVLLRLTFHVVQKVFHFEKSVCDDGSGCFVVFIPERFKRNIFRVVGVEDLVDQWNHQKWHLFSNRAEDIIEDGVQALLFFLFLLFHIPAFL